MGSKLEHGRVVEPRGLSRALSRRSLELARDVRGVAADRAAGLAAGKRGAFHTADVQDVAFAGVDIGPVVGSVGAGGAGAAVGVKDLAPVERAVGVHDLGPQRAEVLAGYAVAVTGGSCGSSSDGPQSGAEQETPSS